MAARHSLLFQLLQLLVLLSTCLIGVDPVKTRGNSRSITIYNACKNKVEILWVHPSTREESLMGGVFPGTDYTLNSFVGHEFVAREKPNKSGDCVNEEKVCRLGTLIVSENDDQMFRITEDFQIEFVDNKIRAEQEYWHRRG